MNKYFGTNFTKPEEIQICTYAICKNELSFLEDWVKNIWCEGKGSNYIVVLDTGSTDGTYERLKTIAADYDIPEGHFIYSQAVVTPWRFDVARNMSLALCPDSHFIDVCYCVDLDERVDEHFWTDLRKMVYDHPDFYRIYYRYAWSHKSNGEPDLHFWYDKIHGPVGWKWEYPVHETLKCDAVEHYHNTYCLNDQIIYLHHWPDQTKSRSSYLKLLELRVKEHPDDMTSNYYLAREYSFNYDWENCIRYCTCALNLITPINRDENTEVALICLKSRCYDKLGDRKMAIQELTTASQRINSRYILLSLAQLVVYTGDYKKATDILSAALTKTTKITSWQIPPWSNSEWKVYQIKADALAWQGKYNEAFEQIKQGKEMITEAETFTATEQGFYADYEFIRNRCGEMLI